MADRNAGDSRNADIFISYQRDNAEMAKRLKTALESENRRVFLDGQIKPNAKWRADIEEKLKRARCVVSIWSQKAATSGWVNYEAFRAQQEGKLIAVTFDPIQVDDLPPWLADQQISNLKSWRRGDELSNEWLKVKSLVQSKCSALPEYAFKGWLAGGRAHDKVTSLAFHPTEDARLLSTGSEGGGATWLATMARQDWRGSSNDDGPLFATDPASFGQDARWTSPQPDTGAHKAALWRGQFSPDGRNIILAGRSGQGYLHNLNLSEAPLALDHNPWAGVVNMAFSKPGGTGGAQREGVADACITASGDVVTVGGFYIGVWSKDGQRLRDKMYFLPEGAQARLVRAVYCDELDAVLLGDKLGKVRVFDPRTGAMELVADRADTDVRIALCGRKSVNRDCVLAIVSAAPSDSEIRIYDLKNGKFGDPRPRPLFEEAPPVHAIAMHPTAPVIAVGSNAVRPRLWDYGVNEPLRLQGDGWHERAVTALAFSASGKFLAVGSEDGRISVWEDQKKI
jgi:WD40 repeat protein